MPDGCEARISGQPVDQPTPGIEAEWFETDTDMTGFVPAAPVSGEAKTATSFNLDSIWRFWVCPSRDGAAVPEARVFCHSGAGWTRLNHRHWLPEQAKCPQGGQGPLEARKTGVGAFASQKLL
jgi:hypothetical protein